MNARSRTLVDAVRRSSWTRRVIGAVGTRQFRVGRPCGLADRAIARLLTLDAPSPAERARTVDSLTELFFDLVAATRVQRFVEAGAKDAPASVRAATDAGVDRVIAFEANPYTHRRFQRAVTAAGVDYRHMALSDKAGEVDFLVRLTDDGTPMADGQGSMLVRPDHDPGYAEVRVEAVCLDDAVDTADPQPPTSLWVDVEGASAPVLRGAPALLGSVQVAIIEVESDRRWTGQEWIDRDVIDFFVGVGLYPVARDRQSRLQYNIVFARSGDAGVSAVVERWRALEPD